MASGKQKQATKVVKKKWFPIRASKFFDSELLGECYIPGPEQLLGRTVSANLANLTGDVRQQSVTLKFVVNAVEGDSGIADVIGYGMASSAIRRIVRRGSDRIDESFTCETSDGRKIRIKPMAITKAITNGAVHRALRNAMTSAVVKQVKKHSFEELINEVITSKLQIAVKSELKPIYPLKSVEVTSLWLIPSLQKAKETEEVKEAAQKEAKGEEKGGSGQAAETAEAASEAA